MSDVSVFRDIEALAESVAARAAGIIRNAIREYSRANIFLSGGSTPRCYLPKLAESLPKSAWRQVQVFMVDERDVAPESEASNNRLIEECLLTRLTLPPANYHPMRPWQHPEADADYEAELNSLPRNPEQSLVADLILLGMGHDGHTASLFPGTAALSEKERFVIWSQGPPPHVRRLTLTLRVLNAARNVLFVVAGSDKAPAVAEVLGSGLCDLPAARVRPQSGRLEWMLDGAAAALLGEMNK
jgi:6-phosphogluconolactonase